MVGTVDVEPSGDQQVEHRAAVLAEQVERPAIPLELHQLGMGKCLWEDDALPALPQARKGRLFMQ